MIVRIVALLSLLVPLAAAQTASQPGEDARPNIVILLSDDLRWDYLGVAGHPFLETPELDRLAREGACFENAVVVTPLCSPSRATLLTGMGIATHRIGRNGGEFPRRISNLAERLKAAGYTTALLGKTGFTDQPKGFDYLVDFLSPQDGGRGDTYNRAVLTAGDRKIKTDGFSTDALAALAVEHLGEVQRPFFLVLSVKNPHVPYTPPARHSRLYNDAEITLPESYRDPVGDLPGLIRHHRDDKAPLFVSMPLQKQYRALERAPSRKPPGPRLIRKYVKMIPSIDDALATLRKGLEEQGHWDNTVMIFTSDNGILLGEKGIFGKELLYEPSIRVPLLIRDPRGRAGLKIPGPVLNLDLAPTCLAYAGLTPPPEMTGRDLRPLLRGQAKTVREDCLLVSGYAPHLRRPAMMGVRGERFKYIRYLRGGLEEELFDLQSDPGERRDLSDDPAAAATLEKMRARLDELAKEDGLPGEWLEPFPF